MKHKTKKQLNKLIKEMQVAIKTDCFDCTGGQKKIDCELKTCALYRFRPWATNSDSVKDS